MSDFIKQYWDSNAEKYKMANGASWNDELAMDLEVENIQQHIKEGKRVLDVGCANGASTIKIFKMKKNIDMTAVDYSESMIKFAEENKAANRLNNNIRFHVANILSLPFKDETFDVTYTTRVLINLPNWEQQKIGIDECIRVTKKGGVVIFSEAFWEPLVLMNSMRTLVGLSPLLEHDFNRYLKKDNLRKYLDEKGLKYEIADFSSVYYIGSRFLRELVTNPDDYPGYSNPINKDFYELEKKYSGGGFGIQQAFVVRVG